MHEVRFSLVLLALPLALAACVVAPMSGEDEASEDAISSSLDVSPGSSESAAAEIRGDASRDRAGVSVIPTSVDRVGIASGPTPDPWQPGGPCSGPTPDPWNPGQPAEGDGRPGTGSTSPDQGSSPSSGTKPKN